MPKLSKRLKWWLRDCWSFLRGKGKGEEPKTIHLMFCRLCEGYHRINVRQTGTLLLSESDMPMHLLFRGGPMRCPKTKEMFVAAQDDWVHLTEREYDCRFDSK